MDKKAFDCGGDGCGECEVCEYLEYLEWAENVALSPDIGRHIERNEKLDAYIKETYGV